MRSFQGSWKRLALPLTLLMASSISLPCLAAETKEPKSRTASNLSQEEKAEARKSLRKKREDLLRSRKSLLSARQRITKRLAHINLQIRSLSQTKARPIPAPVQVQFLKEELENELKLVDIDISLKDLDKEKLALDKRLFDLEKDRFKQQYQDNRKEFLAQVSDLKGDETALKDKALLKSEKELLADLEPIVIINWGERRNQLVAQVFKLRTNRLKLWEDELNAHKSFLTVKQEDFIAKKKRSKLRQGLLKKYFRLKNARQAVNTELVRMEKEHYEASEQMKFQLSSIYRRTAFLSRVSKSKQTSIGPKESAPNKDSETKKLKVGEYGSGVIFGAHKNWASRIAKLMNENKVLKSGDEIVFVDSSPVLGRDRKFESLLYGTKDKEVDLVFLRGGQLYKTTVSLAYRPKEKTHPEILNNLKKAEKNKQPEKLARALLEEVSYIDKYSKDRAVADDIAEQLLAHLEKNKSLPKELRLHGYSACSSHYLARMADCLSRSKRQKKESKDTADSAEFLNKADKAAAQAVSVLSPGEGADFDLASVDHLLKLAKQYSQQHDFKHIVSEKTLREVCQTTEKLVHENADKSYFEAASVLSELASIYELSLKDFPAAAAIESKALAYYLKALPEEALEVTNLRLSLSRNLRKAKDPKEAINQLNLRLSTLESINAISRKAEESTLYDYVVTLKELGSLYQKEKNYSEALSTATKIVDSYNKLDAAEDSTFARALFLRGKSSLEIGKAKKSITYLTDAFKLIRSQDKSDCLIDLSTAYKEAGKAREAKLLALIVKDYLANQYLHVGTTDDALTTGDQAVKVAQIFDDLDEADSAVAMLELALSAYSSDYVINLEPDSEKGKDSQSRKLASHLVKQMRKFDSILLNASRPDRAKAIKKLTEAIETKVSSGDEFDCSWLAKLAW